MWSQVRPNNYLLDGRPDPQQEEALLREEWRRDFAAEHPSSGPDVGISLQKQSSVTLKFPNGNLSAMRPPVKILWLLVLN